MSNPSSPNRPLSFNSGRASPFRRQDSTGGRSASTIRNATPQGSPLKNSTPNPLLQSPPSGSNAFTTSTTADKSWLSSRPAAKGISPPSSPSRTKSPASPSPFTGTTNDGSSDLGDVESNTPSSTTVRPLFSRPQPSSTASTPRPLSQTMFHSTTTPNAHLQNNYTRPSPLPRTTPANTGADPLSALPPQHLHTIRESFTVLDRQNAGAITPADVAVQLKELGLDASPSALKPFFPQGGPQSLNLASYLSAVAGGMAGLSRSEELLNAFSAFDEDDSGQVDVLELREALLHVLPENRRGMSEREVDAVMAGFTGKRMFKKGASGATGGLGPKRDVFRYGDFVAGIWGGAGEGAKQVA